MKFNEFLTEEQLNELDYKKAFGAGLIGAAALGNLSHFKLPYRAPDPEAPKASSGVNLPKREVPRRDEAQELANKILSKYKIKPELALQIAKLALKHQKLPFPSAEDILTIVGIESSFNPDSVSKLKKDPAVGLTQIRPGVHGLDPLELKGDLEKQIEHSVKILSKYHDKSKDKDSTIIKYNVGPGSYGKGKYNQNYINKFNKERELYKKHPERELGKDDDL